MNYCTMPDSLYKNPHWVEVFIVSSSWIIIELPHKRNFELEKKSKCKYYRDHALDFLILACRVSKIILYPSNKIKLSGQFVACWSIFMQLPHEHDIFFNTKHRPDNFSPCSELIMILDYHPCMFSNYYSFY